MARAESATESEAPPASEDAFKGTIELDVRDRVADWTPYELKRAPGRLKGATIRGVGVTVEGTPYIDLEAEAKRVMMSQ